MAQHAAVQKQAKDAGLVTQRVNGVARQVCSFNMTKEPFSDAVCARRATRHRSGATQPGCDRRIGRADHVMVPTTTPWYDAAVVIPKFSTAEAQKLIDAYVAEKGKNLEFTLTRAMRRQPEDRRVHYGRAQQTTKGQRQDGDQAGSADHGLAGQELSDDSLRVPRADPEPHSTTRGIRRALATSAVTTTRSSTPRCCGPATRPQPLPHARRNTRPSRRC
jgi:hypothetical protein